MKIEAHHTTCSWCRDDVLVPKECAQLSRKTQFPVQVRPIQQSIFEFDCFSSKLLSRCLQATPFSVRDDQRKVGQGGDVSDLRIPLAKVHEHPETNVSKLPWLDGICNPNEVRFLVGSHSLLLQPLCDLPQFHAIRFRTFGEESPKLRMLRFAG